ncbi:Inositol-pentakisphosphate 2-kinase [Nymphon striatum]|nr:Inositol-pentakisphosphate 2-kinase [Nymphon striatum]
MINATSSSAAGREIFFPYDFIKIKSSGANLTASNHVSSVLLEERFCAERAVLHLFCELQKSLSHNRALRKKVINQPSGYCPVDLFSGCPERMNSALLGLIRNPQNNLRVFKNGSRIYDQGSALKSLECTLMKSIGGLSLSSKYSVTDWLCDFLIKAFCHHVQDEQKEMLPTIINPPEYCKGHNNINNSNKDISDKCSLNCKHSLPSGCVLARLLAIQKLDTLDISGIYPLYLKIQNILRSSNRHSKQSIFYVRDLNGLCFQVAVKVIDLDPKSPERMDKYFRKNTEMAEIYLKYAQCVT